MSSRSHPTTKSHTSFRKKERKAAGKDDRPLRKVKTGENSTRGYDFLGGNAQDLVELLCKSADYLRERARYDQAEALYRRAHCILEQALEPECSQMANLLNGMAKLSYGQGKYEQAEGQFQQARRILEQIVGPEHFSPGHFFGER